MPKKKVVVINPSWCKGCNICVAFCPKKVLELSEGKIRIARREDCISCGQCELRCPDFAIWLEEQEEGEADAEKN